MENVWKILFENKTTDCSERSLLNDYCPLKYAVTQVHNTQ